MITNHKINNQKIPLSHYEVLITPPHRESLAIKKKALTDVVTQFIDAALTRLIDTRLRNQLNIDSKIPHLASDTSLNNNAHPIDSKLTWRSKNVPTLTDEQKDSLISLELFCKDHNKQLFFGPDECKKIIIENAIWIDDANYSKAAARTFNSIWINPINPKKSLDDLINEIPEKTTCIYLDWDYGQS